MNSFTVSKLYDQDTFYPAFLRDLRHAKSRVIIESPFIASRRMATLFPALRNLRRRGVRVIINTKPIDEHDVNQRPHVMSAIELMQSIDVEVLMTVGHHRKLALVDDAVLYEGSLNILSQGDSCEVMRRVKDEATVLATIRFIGLAKYCK